MIRHEAYLHKSWEEQGLTYVLIARLRDDGSADLAGFLMDLFCLGVKDAFWEPDLEGSGLRDLLDQTLRGDFREKIHPARARKLIEGALAYAESLGFAPHRDFRKARRVLSGIDASLCPRDFSDGRPCYIRGTNDSDERVERVERVLALLEARCGPDGFDYQGLDDDDEEDALATRDDLMAFLDAEPDEVPHFYELSGLLTAMLICPAALSPVKAFDALWGAEGRVWTSEAEAQEFSGLLMSYWSQLDDLIHNAIAPDAHPNAPVLDIWEEDLDTGEPDEKFSAFAMAVASCDWAKGFQRATKLWPEAWGDTLARPDLAPHWEVVDWWAHFEVKENRDKIAAAAESATPRTLNASVKSLARALRLPTTPPPA